MAKRYMLVDVDDATGKVVPQTAEDVAKEEEWKSEGRSLRSWYSSRLEAGASRQALIYALIRALAVLLSCQVKSAARERNFQRASDALRAAMLDLP